MSKQIVVLKCLEDWCEAYETEWNIPVLEPYPGLISRPWENLFCAKCGVQPHIITHKLIEEERPCFGCGEVNGERCSDGGCVR